MATMNGVTPEQMAASIIAGAVESKMIEISGISFQKLETVVRYLNRDKISARGDNWFKKNFDSLTSDAVETLITAREKAITDYQNKKELQDKDELFRTLISRGVDIATAYKDAYGVAYVPQSKETVVGKNDGTLPQVGEKTTLKK
jgi:hypothetical protein